VNAFGRWCVDIEANDYDVLWTRRFFSLLF
jgi:hypothetical protein